MQIRWICCARTPSSPGSECVWHDNGSDSMTWCTSTTTHSHWSCSTFPERGVRIAVPTRLSAAGQVHPQHRRRVGFGRHHVGEGVDRLLHGGPAQSVMGRLLGMLRFVGHRNPRPARRTHPAGTRGQRDSVRLCCGQSAGCTADIACEQVRATARVLRPQPWRPHRRGAEGSAWLYRSNTGFGYAAWEYSLMSPVGLGNRVGAVSC